ncbi:MAG: hypothetical protein E7502_01040 [Ruminococcus sp.]|nr:hypothetical protein [Ruminococcus sp.]
MDIERLKNNEEYVLLGMFGDEPHIALFYKEQPEFRITFWEAYFMDIFSEPVFPVFPETEWYGFTRDWQQFQRTLDFKVDPIPIENLDEYLNDLYTYKERMEHYKDERSRECYRLICDFLAYAKETGMTVMVEEE